MIGGISYFHTYAYDLLATNERIMAASCDAAIAAHREGRLAEGHVPRARRWCSSRRRRGRRTRARSARSRRRCRRTASRSSRSSTTRKAAHEQYGLPYTIVRPFNCVGVGEGRALGEVEVLERQREAGDEPRRARPRAEGAEGPGPAAHPRRRHQVRHYTYGGDLARGIVERMEHPDALNDDFNLSTAQSTTVLELAELIWRKVQGDEPLRLVHDEPFEHDVQKRVPATEKAQRVLGFEATTTLDDMLDEVIPWIGQAMEDGTI